MPGKTPRCGCVEHGARQRPAPAGKSPSQGAFKAKAKVEGERVKQLLAHQQPLCYQVWAAQRMARQVLVATAPPNLALVRLPPLASRISKPALIGRQLVPPLPFQQDHKPTMTFLLTATRCGKLVPHVSRSMSATCATARKPQRGEFPRFASQLAR